MCGFKIWKVKINAYDMKKNGLMEDGRKYKVQREHTYQNPKGTYHQCSAERYWILIDGTILI